MLIPVPGKSAPLNLEINLSYLPPEAILPMSISFPFGLFKQHYRFKENIYNRLKK